MFATCSWSFSEQWYADTCMTSKDFEQDFLLLDLFITNSVVKEWCSDILCTKTSIQI